MMMINFADENEVQQQLSNDLNLIIKTVRTREDQHLQLLEYNKQILTLKRSEEQIYILNDEIRRHQTYLSNSLEQDSAMQQTETLLLQRYKKQCVSFQSVSKLMGRVCARILELFQSAMQKSKKLDKQISIKHQKMKTYLVQQVNNKTKTQLGLITQCILLYTKDKSQLQLKRLRELVKSLEDGEIDALNDNYLKVTTVSNNYIISNTQSAKNSPEKGLSLQKDLSGDKQRAERAILAAKYRQQTFQEEKIRKQKLKMTNRVFTAYSSTMDLSKGQFFDDMVHNNAESKFNKLYNEIYSRNKFNQDQILEFSAKEKDFQEKIKKFKAKMLKKPKNTDLVSDRVETLGEFPQQNQEASTFSPSKETQVNLESKQKRYLISQLGKLPPKISREINTSLFRVTQNNFNHFNFESPTKQFRRKTNKARLPHLPYRNSVGKPEEKLKPVEKYPRKKMALKNIEVGVEGALRKSVSKSEDNKQGSPRSPMQYTFYVRDNKSNSPFPDPISSVLF